MFVLKIGRVMGAITGARKHKISKKAQFRLREHFNKTRTGSRDNEFISLSGSGVANIIFQWQLAAFFAPPFLFAIHLALSFSSRSSFALPRFPRACNNLSRFICAALLGFLLGPPRITELNFADLLRREALLGAAVRHFFQFNARSPET